MSTAAAQPEYAALLARTLPAVIHSEKENERCIAMLETLDHKAEKLTAAERRLAELLTVLIEDFEQETYALKAARPVEVPARTDRVQWAQAKRSARYFRHS